MKDLIKLFDLEKFERPAWRCSFRTVQVFKCPVCGSLTNKAEIEGVFPPGATGRVVYCPHTSRCWHHELLEVLKKFKNARGKRKAMLRRKVMLMRRSNEKHAIDDIIGDVPSLVPWREVSVTETFTEPFCIHFFKTELGKFAGLPILMSN